MKKLFFCFLALFLPAFSTESPVSEAPIINSSWSLNEAYLFLDINLPQDLEFAETYNTFYFTNGQPGTEIHFIPTKKAKYVKDDCSLKDVTYSVQIFYDKIKHEVNYKVDEKFYYENAGWFTTDSTSISNSYTGKVMNADIDINEKPQFFVDDNSDHIGFFVFKKLR